MSKPRYRWWSFARAMVRDYPTLKADLAELHRQTTTSNTSGMPKGGGARRTVESIALRQLAPDDQKVYDAVTSALEITKLRPDGKERVQLIRMMYWAKTRSTAKSAAIQLHISEVTAKRWHGAFVRLVGRCYGFEDDTQEPR